MRSQVGINVSNFKLVERIKLKLTKKVLLPKNDFADIEMEQTREKMQQKKKKYVVFPTK